MDHGTTSTTASERSGNASNLDEMVAESRDSPDGTAEGSGGSVETGTAATEHGENPAGARSTTAASGGGDNVDSAAGNGPAVSTAGPLTEAGGDETASAGQSQASGPGAGTISGVDAFKLPGLPLPTKPLARTKRTNASAVVRSSTSSSTSTSSSSSSTATSAKSKPGTDHSPCDSGPAGQSAATRHGRPAEGAEEEAAPRKTTTPPTDPSPRPGVEFAFAKPKQAGGCLGSAAKAARPPTSDRPPGGGPGESPPPDAGQAADPLAETAAAAAAVRRPREKSPAESLKKAPPLPYKEPAWSGLPGQGQDYRLEVLKGGAIVDAIPLAGRAYHVFGRLETCDVALEHPSLSRHHLVLQYRAVGDGQHQAGFYLYDLGSTHGSWFNKQRMEARVYYRMRVGHMFKLGGSTRLFILQGPAEDQEAESELSVTELRELRAQQLAELQERKRQKTLEKEEEEEEKADASRRKEDTEKDAGITWGMDYEDAAAEDAMGDNPFAVIMTQEEKEATYVKDPKKALRGYFEREGYDLEYSVDEKESGFTKQFVCRVELPVDDASGRPIVAEVAVSGKKKEAVAACALEACRILDAHGVLRQATHESHKRKTKDWKEDDYYDSDEDTFLDRTGEIEKKRMLRMRKAGVIKEKAQTYESLKSELSDVEAEIKQLEAEVSASSKSGASSVLQDDSLDAFMESIKSGRTVDKTWRARMKLRLIGLRKDQARLRRLVDIARPASMPALIKPAASQTTFAALSKKLPMFGSLKGRASLKSKLRPAMPPPKAVPLPSPVAAATAPEGVAGEVEEEDAEEEEEERRPEGVVSPPASQGSPRLTDPAQPETDPAPVPRDVTAMEAKPKPLGETSRPSDSPRHGGPSGPIQVGRRPGDEGVERESGPGESPRPSSGRASGTGGTTGGAPWPSRPGQAATAAAVGGGAAKKKPRLAVGPRREREAEEREDKEDFADWLPPVGQTGDGKTHLNAKYGY